VGGDLLPILRLRRTEKGGGEKRSIWRKKERGRGKRSIISLGISSEPVGGGGYF